MDRKTAEHVFNYRGTDFPVSAKDYHKIEEQNPRGGGGPWVFFGWVCAAQDSKLAPRSKNNFP